MSNVYNLEPQAQGLIILKTTFGDLEVELFTKQCPKNTRKFVQLCLDGYYEGTIFDRIDKDFIAIGGKKQESCETDLESCDIEPDEFHQRLRFSRRGLLATANTQRHQNGPEFFFTLGPAPELQNKHTIFGRLRGNSVFCLVDLNDCPVDEDDMRPLSEKTILEVVVVENPYPELESRRRATTISSDVPKEESCRGEQLEPKINFKNSKKLTFYHDSYEDDDEEEEEEDDLSSPTRHFKVPQSDQNFKLEADATTIKEEPAQQGSKTNRADQTPAKASSEETREKKLREIRAEIQKLKQKLENESAIKIRTLSDRRRAGKDPESALNVTLESRANSSRQSSIDDPDLTPACLELRLAAKKGRQRERETLELMEKFKKKLKETRRPESSSSSGSRTSVTGSSHKAETISKQHDGTNDDDDLDDALDLVDGDQWLSHKFDTNSSATESMAKDANTKCDDWYSVDDPRNSMVKRVETERARKYRNSTRRGKHEEYDQYPERYHRHLHKSSRHHYK